MSSTLPQATPSSSVQRSTQQIGKEVPQVIADAILETIQRGDHVGCWMTDEVLRTHLKRRYNFGEDLDFTPSRLNAAITKYFPGVEGSDHMANPSGLFRLVKGLNRKRHNLYQFAKPGTPFKACPTNMDTSEWAKLIQQASDPYESLPRTSRRLAAKRQRVQTDVDIALLNLHAEMKVAKAVDAGKEINK